MAHPDADRRDLVFPIAAAHPDSHPVLPALAAKVESFFNVAPFTWDDVRSVLAAGHAIRPYRHLMTRRDLNPTTLGGFVYTNEAQFSTPPLSSTRASALRSRITFTLKSLRSHRLTVNALATASSSAP